MRGVGLRNGAFVWEIPTEEGGVDDALFEVPAGYQKMNMPAGRPKMK